MQVKKSHNLRRYRSKSEKLRTFFTHFSKCSKQDESQNLPSSSANSVSSANVGNDNLLLYSNGANDNCSFNDSVPSEVAVEDSEDVEVGLQIEIVPCVDPDVNASASKLLKCKRFSSSKYTKCSLSIPFLLKSLYLKMVVFMLLLYE